jgi:lipopolysaccharide/colanic/teichoic acid biosynthesis glycosyltransferase
MLTAQIAENPARIRARPDHGRARWRLAKLKNSSYRLAFAAPSPTTRPLKRAHWDVKRAFDIIVSALLLTLGAPLLAAIALLVRARLGAPVLFVQMRPGLNGAPFAMRKFRTMTDARDESGALLDDSARLTPFGRWLRSTSLDELPEVWSVLVGDMSFVGPRPLLSEYLPLYSPEQARRHQVKPGLTGWAQINGRNAISWEERFRLDVWYVDHQSFLLDLKILALSFAKILRREGISHEGEATMPRFLGSLGETERP